MTNGTKLLTNVRRPAGALNLRFEAASGGHVQNLNASHANCRKGGGEGAITTPGARQLEPGNYSTVLARQSRSNCGRTCEYH